ncbi:putative CDP-diacylglycerol--glycerol-3-phosphate 3-phosphatidyl-transferase 2 [Nostocoides japonicum T1-X7]|uniref:CDP-diacylglycerol--glycerol-3-phosphate 3-phosphatidyltransferase n=1 Tax=Nostocoides japonicum T1-X7 TaxID=1194083 RepID=A0A077LWA4_9MICO|nr:CDP-diacylglycerol--glycerol-3-phosphate 3-phosphatidyltransferase [Tetrasphaera japonica]CCH76279.1 putative CDP-diacylglycerol--glycerol-3-phosphate 3-phosphatidyl-transferase 2 [Tetrasphaera japonica T1-X7]
MTPGRTGAPGPVAVPGPSVWNIANALTILRLVLVPVFGWFLLAEGGDRAGYRYAAAGIFFVAMVTDFVDGDLARSRNLVTDFGKVVDPIADKALMTMALAGLSSIGEVPWWITVVFLIREWGITALRFVVIRHGVLPASRGGKVKTLLQALALWLFVLPLWTWPAGSAWRTGAWVVLLAALVVTVVTGLDYVGRAMRLRRTSERALRKRARRARQTGRSS